jgi:ankyrin repeat protein
MAGTVSLMNSRLCFRVCPAMMMVLLAWRDLPAADAPPTVGSLQNDSANSLEQLAGVDLAYAVRKGDLARARNALADAPSLLAETKARQALLVLAAQEGHPSIVEWLLANGASAADTFGNVSPLAAAVDLPRDIFLERQEQNPAAWDLIQAAGKTSALGQPAILATDHASGKGSGLSLELSRLLFAPLPPDILVGKTKVIELLLAAGARPPRGTEPETGIMPFLFMAIVHGFDGDVVNRLIQAGADPGVVTKVGLVGTTPLHAAALSGNLSAAKVLLACHVDMERLCFPLPAGQRGMQVATGGLTPLMLAIWWGQEAMVRCLLEHGAKVESSNRTLDRAVHVAAFRGQPGLLRLLLERGARIDYGDMWQSTPLHYAALLGRLELVQMLLQAGADLEVADEAGFTPLLNAVEYDRLETVKFLLDHGASRRARTFGMGKGPLRVAATTNALAVAEYLIGLGEKVDGDGTDSMRPLHEAASTGHSPMVALLLRHGALTEVRDHAFQGTPLHSAIRARPNNAKQQGMDAAPPKASYSLVQGSESSYLEIIRLLAEHGADLNATDRAGFTALHCSAEFGDVEAVELLLKLGARRDLKNGKDMTPYDLAWLKGKREICLVLQPGAQIKP